MPLQTYRNYRPTQFDTQGLALADRQDWLVCPVIRTRDAGPLERTNYRIALLTLGGESETVEVHSFNHWGCGWFDIILVKPGTEAATLAQGIADSLDSYPCLDDYALSEEEDNQAQSVWDDMPLRSRIEVCQRFGVSILQARKRFYPLDAQSYLAAP